MNSKKLWYAVSATGQGHIFTEKPEREEKLGVWKGRIVGCYCAVVIDMATEGLIRLPKLNWRNEPVELKLTITHG